MMKGSAVVRQALRASQPVRTAYLPHPHSLPVNGFVGAIGNTPLIRINSLSDETGCEILGKAEFMNPGGSVKDRAALGLVDWAEKSGRLKPGGTIVEGTAGNTGIGLAHVALSKGYKCVIYMPNTQSQEKIDLLRMLGAEVYPVPAVAFENPENYNHQAKRHAEKLDNAVWMNQFDNADGNRAIHIKTTGPEIWEQTSSLPGGLQGFICSTGTGGTLAGTTRYLKEKSNGKVQCWLADPPGSVLEGFVNRGVIERGGSSITEGIGQGRVTDNLKHDVKMLDGAIHIPDEETIRMVYHLLAKDGFFFGASTALNVVSAKKLAEKLGRGSRVVTILCDGASRYMTRVFSRKWLESKPGKSGNLYEAIPEEYRRFASLP